ncbi:MAG: hypothetical protein XE11_2659, partial [Methanomicrobiales archaeon 53_19]
MTANSTISLRARGTFTHPIRTGRVNLRTVAGAACGTYKCSLVRFEINCLWDKHQLKEQFFRKRA